MPSNLRMIMEINEIKQCRICGNPHFISILNLRRQTLSGRFPRKEESDPPAAPLELIKCDNFDHPEACGLVQLRHSVSPDELYQKGYGYRSGINQTMRMHLNDVATKAAGFVEFEPGDVILDIGSNDATLLRQYNTPASVTKLGIDAGGEQYKQYYPENIQLICGYFNAPKYNSVTGNKKAKLITSIAMFYDLEHPLEFVKDIHDILHPEGIWVMEQSYLPKMLSTNSFDTICHEHLEYYDLHQIDWMMKKQGMRIVDVEFNDINGGSFKVSVCHEESKILSNTENINSCLADEQNNTAQRCQPYIAFKNRVDAIKKQLITFLESEKRKGKTIYIYGASTKGNVLLQYFDLDTSLITAAADRNPSKWGCRTPKTNIPIISEEDARKQKPDYFLVLPWHFKDEFIEREKEFLTGGGHFIFPLPNVEIV